MRRWILLCGVVLLTLHAPTNARSLSELTSSLPCEGVVLAAAPPNEAPPTPPGDVPSEPDDWRQARDFEGSWQDADYGVGFLHSTNPDGDVWGGLRQLVTPFYQAPGGPAVGWLNRGWVQEGMETRALAWAGTVETGYETLSLLLYEARDDGWLQVRVRVPRPGDTGRVWIHTCRLGEGSEALEPVLWSDFFLKVDLPLSFRKRVPHVLRAGPSTEGEILARLGVDDEVEALEIRGDWMRVRAQIPGKFQAVCRGDTPWQGRRLEGWIRWRDDRKGPWLYWPTRGC